MPEPNSRAGEILRGPDGDRIYLLLLEYAHNVARRYGWTVGRSLPHGASPESVTNEVIIKVLEGERNWDEDKEPSLVNALRGMVKSEINHLFSSYEATHVESVSKDLPDGSQRTADDFPAGANVRNPEELLLNREQTKLEMTALEMILDEIEGDSELEAVFLALYETDKPKEIAQLTGISVERIYSLRRELTRIAAKITPERVARTAREKGKQHER